MGKIAELNQVIVTGNDVSQRDLENLIDKLWKERVALGDNGCVIELRGNTGSAATAISRNDKLNDLICAGCTVMI